MTGPADDGPAPAPRPPSDRPAGRDAPAPDQPPADVTYRPHHFLCSLGFQGKGYSDGFTANMAGIVEGRLRAPGGGATALRVAGGLDDICGPCPRRRGDTCTTEDKIARLDAAHAAALGLAPGDRLTWAEALARIRARVRPGDLARLCAGCEWLAFGMCEAALARLHAGPATLAADTAAQT